MALSWSSCGTGFDCATLSVPLEYANPNSGPQASIALIRYNATAQPDQRLGSLLVNPGGPGASGVDFVAYGAGPAVSTISGGLYDIIGWDPRGIGESSPLIECFANAGDEYTFSSQLPGGPNLWLGEFSNSSYDAQVSDKISAFDAAVANLSQACVAQNSSALYTSSSAYVARDMAAIVDAVDGADAKLNYWGFSYGTLLLSEFIQAFPERVGRVVADGVVNPQAVAETAAGQLPIDQFSERAALDDLIAFCEAAGATQCPLSVAPPGVTGSLSTRIDNLFADLFINPIQASGLSISLDIFNPFLVSFLRVPATWATVANTIKGLEVRNATAFLSLLSEVSAQPPTNTTAPGVGTENTYPLSCIDNAPSSDITLAQIVELTKNISITENTPTFSADLSSVCFCRNFPDTRPLLANAGVSLMAKADSILSAAKKTILIVNSEHDPTTPLISAKVLRSLLPNSSKLAIRGGPGHTTISLASLSMAQTISDYFVCGTLPRDLAYNKVDEEVFPDAPITSIATPPVFNGSSYTASQQSLLNATYDIGLAFLALA